MHDSRAELETLPSTVELARAGFGVGFNDVDARILYGMLRRVRPRRYFEIGSGISTAIAACAARANAPDDPLEIVCVEPHPYRNLYAIPGVTVLRRPAQELAPSFFQSLEANDVLFIDSSHILRIDGDVAYLYLEILPSLRPGVVIHIHDIPFPYNVPHPPEQWVFAERRDSLFWPVFWNEAMLVQALLSGNPTFEIVLSAPLLRHHDESFLRELLPGYESIEENPDSFSSLWIRKRS
jgi:predicted O-methyltransferase YrrM